MSPPTSTPTPTPTPTQLKSARKLPIKRKPALDPKPDLDPLSIPHDNDNEDDDDDDLDADDDSNSNASGGPADGSAPAPPFRYQRIWSESDEIRFLQGLLGCFSQGFVFPRDLNLFYDRFSESMPQPYTRSQLSEKLRRLRKKYRVMSGRIARGQDPARLAPHDRDLLHLCTRLWHPSYSSSSPFAAADVGNSGGSGNKRRRPNPRVPSGRSGQVNGHGGQVVPSEQLLPPPHADVQGGILRNAAVEDVGIGVKMEAFEEEEEEEEKSMDGASAEFVKREELHVEGGSRGGGVPVRMDDSAALVAKSILSVFDGCVKEAREELDSEGMRKLDGSSGTGEGNGKLGLERRWREQRIAEMDVLVRRMRLIVENAIKL